MGDSNICGDVRPGFETVREAFAENFKRRNELGAACCVYHRGEKVVDLWGGVRDMSTGELWEEDTMVLVASTTKGLAGLVMALAHSRGMIDYDERVCSYWPQFAQQGKKGITIRQLLAHQAGLYALDQRLDAEALADLDRLAGVLAEQKPAWEPGSRQAYHAITIGFYEGEILRRVDPKHRSLGQFFQDEIATPLGLEFYIRLPEEIPNSKLAPIVRFTMADALSGIFVTPLFVLSTMTSRSRVRRALLGSELPTEASKGRIYARDLEVPAGGGVGTARGIAKAYSAFATGGGELGLRGETLRELMAPAHPSRHGFYDECLKTETRFSLGFSKLGETNELFGDSSSFGALGSGGSCGYADPHNRIGYAYIMNRMKARLVDPRDEALRKAMYRSIRNK